MCTRYHCAQFQYDHPGRRTSLCAQDIIVLSFSTITLGVRQAHVHKISCQNSSNDKSIVSFLLQDAYEQMYHDKPKLILARFYAHDMILSLAYCHFSVPLSVSPIASQTHSCKKGKNQVNCVCRLSDVTGFLASAHACKPKQFSQLQRQDKSYQRCFQDGYCFSSNDLVRRVTKWCNAIGLHHMMQQNTACSCSSFPFSAEVAYGLASLIPWPLGGEGPGDEA